MSITDDPDIDGMCECPKCKGVGYLPWSKECQFCKGTGKGGICKEIKKRKMNCQCLGSHRSDGRCLLTGAKCRKDEKGIWTEVDCRYCDKGIIHVEEGTLCPQCKGAGRLDWIQRITSGARAEEPDE